MVKLVSRSDGNTDGARIDAASVRSKPNFDATARLQAGDFANGWGDYESRWNPTMPRPVIPLSEWDGSSPADKRIFVYGEQDLGEQILFASCLPELLPRTRGCRLECDWRLVSLFQRSFPLADVVPKSEPSDTGDCEFQIALGSLPRLLRRNETDFQRSGRWLAVDRDAVRRWRMRLADLRDRPLVGISWRGGSERDDRIRRSTTLNQWEPVLRLPKVAFVNLQYDGEPAEWNAVRDVLGTAIHHWDDVNPRKHLDDFAAQIATLDLVITVDNSTAHLAGALGVPTWTLLPKEANWRWLKDRTDSPWFPSMRLFRQQVEDDWSAVFAEVADDLRSRR